VISFDGILEDSQKANSESSERHTTISPSKETNPTSFHDSSPTTIVTKTQTIQTFETLSLVTSQQPDDTVMLHYEDTPEKTIMSSDMDLSIQTTSAKALPELISIFN